MATMITSECINCGACEPECPNTAIYQGGVEWDFNGEHHAALAEDIFYIVPEKCTECVGFHDQEACAVVCPVDCCVPNPDIPETEEVLIARAQELHPEESFAAPFPSRFRSFGAAAPAEAAPAPAAAAPSAADKPAPAAAKPAPAPAVEKPAPAPAAEKPPPAPATAKPTAEKPTPAPVAAKPAAAPAAEKPAAAPAAAKPAAAPAPPKTAAVAPVPATARVERPISPPPAPLRPALALKSAPLPEGPFRGELPESFEDALESLGGPPATPSRRLKLLAVIARPLLVPFGLDKRMGGEVCENTVPVDGFHSIEFEDKLERERRYGEVYTLTERANGYLLQMELPRRIPPTAEKAALGLPDEMPDYKIDLALQDGYFVVKGKVIDPNLRRVAAVSPAFPPDFTTHIKLRRPMTAFKHRYQDKTLEVVLLGSA